jgi:hypothetical protein
MTVLTAPPAAAPARRPWLARLGRLLAIALGVGAAACSSVSSAQTDADIDPPARIGRVALADGPVWLESAGSGDAINAPLNWPVSGGDVIATGDRGRAELSVGSTRLRLGADSRLRVLQLDDQSVELELQRGALALSIVSAAVAREFSVVSSAGSIEPIGAGFYRLDVEASSGDAAASVWHGELRVRQGEASLRLASGQRAELYRDGGWRLGGLQRDSFARWAEAIDGAAALPAGLSAEMTGADSLAANGEWRQVDEWGLVWFPRLAIADWAPYRYGRWARIEPWGWTWIDDAPWGFATSHYGRWVLYLGRWCWLPGTAVARPAYAPALVVWGDGGGYGVAPPPRLIGPGVRWLPLAPGAAYVPEHRYRPAPDRNDWRDRRNDGRFDNRRDDNRGRVIIVPPASDRMLPPERPAWAAPPNRVVPTPQQPRDGGNDRPRDERRDDNRGRVIVAPPADRMQPPERPAWATPPNKAVQAPQQPQPQPQPRDGGNDRPRDRSADRPANPPRSPLLEPVMPQPRPVQIPNPPPQPAPIVAPPPQPRPPEVRPHPAAPAASSPGGGGDRGGDRRQFFRDPRGQDNR